MVIFFLLYHKNIANKIDGYCNDNTCGLICFEEIASNGNRALYFGSNISFLNNICTFSEVNRYFLHKISLFNILRGVSSCMLMV